MKTVLYHGSSEIIVSPEIREPNRTLDYGKGFYLTTSREQAERLVRNRMTTVWPKGFVNSYSFDMDLLKESLKIKSFGDANDEWVDFVMKNRMMQGFEHDYDIVIGPVADDKVYAQFSLFEGGIISKETLVAELKTYKLVNQYLFHTEKSLKFLEFITHYEVI